MHCRRWSVLRKSEPLLTAGMQAYLDYWLRCGARGELMRRSRQVSLLCVSASLAFACNSGTPSISPGPIACKVPASDTGCTESQLCQEPDGAILNIMDIVGPGTCKAPTHCPEEENTGIVELTCAGGAVPDPSFMCVKVSSSNDVPSFYCCPCQQPDD